MDKKKIAKLENSIKAQSKMLAMFTEKKKETQIKSVTASLKNLKEELSKEQNKDNTKKAKYIGKTKAECEEIIAKLEKQYTTDESTKKKNIKSGRATSDGTLKASASLKNEDKSLESKADAGQKISKTEQKAIAFSIENVVKSCVEMIPYKKDANTLLSNLIRKLQEIQSDISSGRLRPGSNN